MRCVLHLFSPLSPSLSLCRHLHFCSLSPPLMAKKQELPFSGMAGQLDLFIRCLVEISESDAVVMRSWVGGAFWLLSEGCGHCHHWGRQSGHVFSPLPPLQPLGLPILPRISLPGSMACFLPSPLKPLSIFLVLQALADSLLLLLFLWKSFVISYDMMDPRGQECVESSQTLQRIASGCVYGMCTLQAKELQFSLHCNSFYINSYI